MELLERLLNIEDVESVIKLKKSKVFQLKKIGLFPAGILIGTSRRWPESHIQAWLKEQIEGAGK